jgi:hypothetical protein
LILLLLFATGCRPTELVDAKKRRDSTSSDDDDLDDSSLDTGKRDDDFCAENNKDSSGGGNLTSGTEEEMRHFDVLRYEDVRLIVVRNPNRGKGDAQVTMAYYKGHKRCPKL